MLEPVSIKADFHRILLLYNKFYYFFSFFILFSVTEAAYGSSQAGGRIGAAGTAGLHHSHTGSEPGLQPTPQLTATPDP